MYVESSNFDNNQIPVTRVRILYKTMATDLLKEKLEQQADDYEVIFVVHPNENAEKSKFMDYWRTTHHEETQIMSNTKHDEMVRLYDEECKYLFVDVPRLGMQFLNYHFLQMVKDRRVDVHCEDPHTKRAKFDVHVVVMCNEHPDMTKFTRARYDIIVG